MVNAQGVLEAIDYNFYPWGNAYFNTTSCGGPEYDKDRMFCWVQECGHAASPPDDCFSGVKLCQHGEDECKADTLEACVMAVYPNPSDWARFVTCFEGEYKSNMSFAAMCAGSHALDWDLISSCVANETRAQKLDVAIARETAALGVAKEGTPWVLINGEHVETSNLLQQVCAAIGDSPQRPVGCEGV